MLLIHLGMSGSLRIWQQAVACDRVRAFGHTPYQQPHKTCL